MWHCALFSSNLSSRWEGIGLSKKLNGFSMRLVISGKKIRLSSIKCSNRLEKVRSASSIKFNGKLTAKCLLLSTRRQRTWSSVRTWLMSAVYYYSLTVSSSLTARKYMITRGESGSSLSLWRVDPWLKLCSSGRVGFQRTSYAGAFTKSQKDWRPCMTSRSSIVISNLTISLYATTVMWKLLIWASACSSPSNSSIGIAKWALLHGCHPRSHKLSNTRRRWIYGLMAALLMN